MREIDRNRPVQTAEGAPVEIITTKGRGIYPLIGYIGSNVDNLHKWDKYGRARLGLRRLNLIQESAVLGWVNIYPAKFQGDSAPFCYGSRLAADNAASSTRLACIKVMEGQFDE